MKCDETFRDFLGRYLNTNLHIVTKVGTICDGCLMKWGEHSLVLQGETSMIVAIRDILSIEETGGKKPFGYESQS
ncbi:hypothetical protein M0R72_07030 [Candidatus Pacearchaeota archaeon]|nr:hypothetical protein [Candidatus Pacearchaeota archaeon]